MQLQILSIEDNATDLPISVAKVFMRPDNLGPDEDGQYIENMTSLIVIPIVVSKCTYILIEAKGYQDWEQAFYPSKEGNLPVNIRLAPADTPLPEKQTG